ncbi:MAG: SAM-dependent methyltransferase, partial [Candidatus Lutacidiplasmatales archaeon]
VTAERDGPKTCSGLPVARYDAATLAQEFGPRFRLTKSSKESHRTPWRTVQPFTYVVLRRASS